MILIADDQNACMYSCKRLKRYSRWCDGEALLIGCVDLKFKGRNVKAP